MKNVLVLLAILLSCISLSVKAASLMLHYQFNEGTGLTIADASGNNITGIWTSSRDEDDPIWVCEVDGYYLDFDNSLNQHVSSAAFTPPSEGAVAFWLKVPASPSSRQRVFGFGDGWELRWESNDIMYFDINKTGSNSSIRSSSAITATDTWMHIAFKTNVSTGDWSLYIDGVLDNNGNASLTSQNASFLTIGGSTWKADSGYFTGSIDDFRLYSGDLSEAEIIALAASPPIEDTNCAAKVIAEYRFDETQYNDVSGEVIESINGLHGRAKSAQPTVGKVCNAVDLSAGGINDYVVLDASVLSGKSDFTISLWAKTAKTSNQSLVSGARSAPDNELIMWFNSHIAFRPHLKGGQNGDVTTLSIADDNWHHLVWTRKGSQSCLYRDKIEQGCVTQSSDALDIQSLILGQEQDSVGGDFVSAQAFDGLLDEVLIFDGAISATKVSEIYDNQEAGLGYDGTPRDEVTCNNNCGAGTLDAVGIRIDGGGSNTQINTTTEALAIHAAWLAAGSPASGLINGDIYNVAASGSSTVDRIDFGGKDHDFLDTLPYPGTGVSGEDFLVHASGTLSLPAGDYTIYVESDDGFSFIMDTLSGDTVAFNKFGNSTSGDSNELRHENRTGNSNTGGSFTLSQDSVFDIAAIFFERTGGDFFEISIANDIRTAPAPSGYEILGNGALNDKVKFGQCVTPSQIDHFEITHDGQGLTCDAETITIKACADDLCTTLNDDATEVQLLINGTFNKTVTVTGSTDTSFAFTTPSIATLSLDQTYQCKNGNSTSCDLVFADAGFRFLYGAEESSTFGNQISGNNFINVIKLQAVEDVNGVCIGLFTGNKEVEMSQQNIAPGGTTGLSFNVGSTSVAKYPIYTSNMTLNFDTDSKAIITDPLYLDAGQIRLHAKYDVDGINLAGNSNNFWVSPAKLIISAKSGGADIDGSVNASPIKHKAGQPFDLTVTAYNALGGTDANITVNYTPNDMQLLLTRMGPTLGGVDGSFNYGNGSLASAVAATYQSVSLNNFSSGVSSTSIASYSEVGLLNLDIQDVDYGYSGNIIAGDALDIGRFYPDYFAQTVVESGSLDAVCNQTTSFAYSGQVLVSDADKGAISYLVNPVVELTAKNVQGKTTKNYTEAGYNKLSAAKNFIVQPTIDVIISGKDSNFLPLTADMYAGTVSHHGLVAGEDDFGLALDDGVLHYELSGEDNFFYPRNENSEVNAQDNDINFLIDQTNFVDSDGVAIKSPVDITNTMSINIRFGRAYLANSFGPETSNLPQPLFTQYLNNSGRYVTNEQDDCINYNATNINLTSGTLSENFTSVSIASGQLDNGETKAMVLTAPGAGNQGTIAVEYQTYSWLKYHWDWNGVEVKVLDQNPTATATFGLYRGNDRIIYQREVH